MKKFSVILIVLSFLLLTTACKKNGCSSMVPGSRPAELVQIDTMVAKFDGEKIDLNTLTAIPQLINSTEETISLFSGNVKYKDKLYNLRIQIFEYRGVKTQDSSVIVDMININDSSDIWRGLHTSLVKIVKDDKAEAEGLFSSALYRSPDTRDTIFITDGRFRLRWKY